MKNDYLNMLASLVLPAQILDYFLISGVEQTSQEIHISLDEKMNPELSNNIHFTPVRDKDLLRKVPIA